MVSSGERSHVEQLRDAVAARVRATTLRGTAREVGMTAPGLQSFIDGTKPHPRTLRKVESWYVRTIAQSGADLNAQDAVAALFLLTRDLPETRQLAAIRRMTEYLETLYEGERIPPPVWLRALKEQLKGEEMT